jgi:MFS family permease
MRAMRVRLGGIGDALADRNFRVYTIGSVTSWVAFFMQVVAVSWTAWELTHSTKWLAIIAVLDIAPNLLFVPLGSTLADRYDRFRIVVISYVFALLQAAALAVLAYSGHLSIWPLAVLVFLHGTIHSFSVPASYGMLPRFVAKERLASAIAVNSAYTQVAIVAGPILAGWLIGHQGIAFAFAVNAAGYVIYLVSIAFLRSPADYAPAISKRGTILGDFLEGMRYIAGHTGIATLLVLMLLGDVLSGALYQMLPAYSTTSLGLGIGGMTTILAVFGAGATCAALWLAHGGMKRLAPLLLICAFGVCALGIGAVVLADQLWLAIGAALVWGMARQIHNTGTIALLQTSIDDRQRGRVMGTEFLLSRLSAGIGAYLIGATADRHGLQLPMLVAVALCLVAWVYAFTRHKRIAAAFQPPS